VGARFGCEWYLWCSKVQKMSELRVYASGKSSLGVHEHGSTGKCNENHEISPCEPPAAATSICDPSGPMITVPHRASSNAGNRPAKGSESTRREKELGGAELQVGLRKSVVSVLKALTVRNVCVKLVRGRKMYGNGPCNGRHLPGTPPQPSPIDSPLRNSSQLEQTSTTAAPSSYSCTHLGQVASTSSMTNLPSPNLRAKARLRVPFVDEPSKNLDITVRYSRPLRCVVLSPSDLFLRQTA
jgi:hypothetical protein